MMLWSLFPIYWAVNTSLMSNRRAQMRPAQLIAVPPTLRNYTGLLAGLGSAGSTSAEVARALLNTTVEAGGGMVLTIILAVLAGYAFARLQFKGQFIMLSVIIGTLAIPGYAILIGTYRIMDFVGLINTYVGIVLVYTVGFAPLGIWVMYNTFRASPVTLEEAGLVDGASRLRVFWSIALPLARPGVAAVGIITFLFGWGGFLFPLVLSSGISTEPITVLLPSLVATHVEAFTLENAVACLALLVPICIVFFANKWIISGLLTGSSR